MITIDQRILIPTSPVLVWQHISDLAKNPTWQVDCESISFLSSRRKGPAVRWRYRTTAGREYVAETSAWYDSIGYEYTFVDGAPYKDARGRIRLQEIPEGTIVQWTFNYEPSGLIGGLRNSLGMKRQIESIMVDSLRTLWQHLRDSQGNGQGFEAKSIMRDAPDVEARALYKPRYPSVLDQNGQVDHGNLIIPEPPITKEDTQPAVAEPQPPAAQKPSTTYELDFLARYGPPESQASQLVDGANHTPESPSPNPAFSPPPTDADVRPNGLKTPGKWPELQQPGSTANQRREQPPPAASSLPFREPPVHIGDSGEIDTSRVSVFDVFGLPKPSEHYGPLPGHEQQAAPPQSPPVMPSPPKAEPPPPQTPPVMPSSPKAEAPLAPKVEPPPPPRPTYVPATPPQPLPPVRMPEPVEKAVVRPDDVKFAPPKIEARANAAPPGAPPAVEKPASRAAPVREESQPIAVTGQRVGLRLQMRQQRVRVRRPA